MLVKVTKDNFEEEVLKSDKKVLVDFNANWCGPCRMLTPILEKVAKKNKKVKIASINIDEEEYLATKYNVFSIPCLVLFNDGKEEQRSVGLISEDDLESFIGN